ncbi:hypothetical protein BOTCAL_0228g00090 [Botryotinia calthae]|uniref:Uncharacterized protein n=1 Tax=Botryotinia calthae TaxID=38488 RepID=A0A4Y8D000_9HELO|nr:hypothetical protein BOTCAL_0228g00090 [Botryotinia calthae]
MRVAIEKKDRKRGELEEGGAGRGGWYLLIIICLTSRLIIAYGEFAGSLQIAGVVGRRRPARMMWGTFPLFVAEQEHGTMGIGRETIY